MKYVYVLAVLCLSLFVGSSAFAASGHYTLGVEGIKVASLPPEGFHWRMYNVLYTADRMNDKSGKETGDFKASVYALANRFVYMSDIKILGANLGMDVIVPLVYTNISMNPVFDENRFGLGDISMDPILLSWHGERWDGALALGGYFPTGEFDRNKPASPGKGFWTGMASLGATIYLDEEKSWSVSALARYQVHSERRDSNGFAPGDHFHVEWGIGKRFLDIFEVGIAGYNLWQVAPDRGRGATNDREQINGIGPEISVAIPAWQAHISLRSLWEYDNRNASQGNTTVLTITKSF
jgi:hypothetical protein